MIDRCTTLANIWRRILAGVLLLALALPATRKSGNFSKPKRERSWLEAKNWIKENGLQLGSRGWAVRLAGFAGPAVVPVFQRLVAHL